MTPRLLGDEMLGWSDLNGRHGPGPARGDVLAALLATTIGGPAGAAPGRPPARRPAPLAPDEPAPDGAAPDGAAPDGAAPDAAAQLSGGTAPTTDGAAPPGPAGPGRTLVVGPHAASLIDAVPPGDLTVLVRGVADAEALAARYTDRPGVTVCCGSLARLAGRPGYDTVIALDGLSRLSCVEGAELSWGEALRLLLAALRPAGRLLLAVENFLGLHRLVALPGQPTDSDWAPAAEYDPTRPAGLPRLLTRLRAAGLTVARGYAAFGTPTAPTALLGTGLLDRGPRGVVEAILSRASVPAGEVLADPRRLALAAARHAAAGTLAPGWIMLARRGPAGWPDTPEGLTDRYQIRGGLAGRWSRYRDGAVEDLPDGDTLARLLIAGCLRRDLLAVRGLLTGWQSGAAAGVPADQVIVGPRGELTGLEPPGTPAGALRRLADTLLSGAIPHPWPTPTDADDLARTLAAMAGRDLDPAGPPGTPVADRPDLRAFRELSADRDRLAAELSDARATARWYRETLDARERDLAEARRTIGRLTATGPARLGAALMAGARTARHTVRVTARRLRSGD